MATKRYVALLSIIMLMFGTKAFAYDIGARNADGVTIYYNFINDGTELEVTRYPTGSFYSGDLVIPEEVTLLGITRKVTSIGGAFFNCQNLTSVTIPNTVTIIHRESFANSGLTSITIPNSVTSVGWFAFAYCYNLSSVTIGNNVKSIGKAAFYDCVNLISVTIGNSVTSIEDGAFSGCSRLSNVIIPNSVTSIGDVAFADCGLTSITIPNSVTRIGGQAFYGCNMMKKVITKIENPFAISGDTFDKYTYSNGELHVPSGTMGKYKNKEGWRNFINIRESTSEIQKQRTIHLAKAGTLPDMISEDEKYYIEELTLTGELNGTDFRLLRDMAGNNHLGERTNGGLVKLDISNAQVVSGGYKYLETQLIRFYGGTVSVLNHNISVAPNEIPYMAFCGCTLESIVLPNSVEAIGESAFGFCRSLTSVTIPNNVKNIGEGAFQYCYNLSSITIPNSVTSIGVSAFQGCKSLTSITIPNSVTSIGGSTFNGCEKLTSVTIGNSVTSIGVSTFQGCKSLTSITIPNSVTSIGECAFDGCNIEEVFSKIENPFAISSSTFNDYTFNNGELYVPTGTMDKYKTTEGWCYFKNIIQKQRTIHIAKAGTLLDLISEKEKYKIEELTLTGELNGTDFRLLRDMAGNNHLGERTNGRLVKLDISNAQIVSGGLKYLETGYIKIGRRKYDINDISINSNEIPNMVFCGCTLKSIILPNSVEAIGESAFCHCSGLSSIVIPNSVKSIGESAFLNCSGLTSVTIGSSVTSIGLCAFQNCERLTSIFIPNSVTSIGWQAFYGCDMEEVLSKIENPFAISSSTFNDNTFNNGKLYVPIGTVEKYKTTGGWNRFNYIVEGSPSNIIDIENEEANEIKRYTISGSVITVPQKGINIIKMKNGTTQKVVVK